MLLTVVLAAFSFGINVTLWSLVGGARWLSERRMPEPEGLEPRGDAVAILIAARDESLVIEATLAAAARQVPADQIYVVSDGSTDDTAALARDAGANVLEVAHNRGKAAALAAGLDHFELCRVYEVVLILDADTELAADYLQSGLALFRDPAVAVVAGMVRTRWHQRQLSPPLGRMLLAYRERLYLLAQYTLKFGQSWAPVDGMIVAPGCASMYRTSALEQLDIAVPGLVIEDFDMTFAVHRQELGRVAFHPRAAIAHTQDPSTLRDYRRQVRRWALGFWQTVLRHRWRRRRFEVVLGLQAAETVTSSLIFLVVVLAMLSFAAGTILTSLGDHSNLPGSGIALRLVLAGFVPDVLISLTVALLSRRFAFVTWAVAFPFVRILDSWLALRGFASAFTTRSTGVWVSPARSAGQVRAPLSVGAELVPGGRLAPVRRLANTAIPVGLTAIAVTGVAAIALASQSGAGAATGCLHPVAGAKPSVSEQRAIARVMSYTDYISAGSRREPDVALTFDDGPGPYTPQVLAVLRRYHAPATFFVVGVQVRYFGKDLSGEGTPQFVIGDHTYTHPLLQPLSPAAQRYEILAQVRAIESCGAPYPHLFRPPYGGFDKVTLGLLKRYGMLMVLWSVDPRDWTRPGVAAIVHNVLANARAGSIIQLHDAGGPRSQTIAALPGIIKGLRARHLRFVTVPQLLLDDPPNRHQPPPRSLSGPVPSGAAGRYSGA